MEKSDVEAFAAAALVLDVRVSELEALVEALARETRTEPAYVRQLYEKALAELEANAKIRGYLAVLAGKGVRTALRADRNANRR